MNPIINSIRPGQFRQVPSLVRAVVNPHKSINNQPPTGAPLLNTPISPPIRLMSSGSHPTNKAAKLREPSTTQLALETAFNFSGAPLNRIEQFKRHLIKGDDCVVRLPYKNVLGLRYCHELGENYPKDLSDKVMAQLHLALALDTNHEMVPILVSLGMTEIGGNESGTDVVSTHCDQKFEDSINLGQGALSKYLRLNGARGVVNQFEGDRDIGSFLTINSGKIWGGSHNLSIPLSTLAKEMAEYRWGSDFALTIDRTISRKHCHWFPVGVEQQGDRVQIIAKNEKFAYASHFLVLTVDTAEDRGHAKIVSSAQRPSSLLNEGNDAVHLDIDNLSSKVQVEFDPDIVQYLLLLNYRLVDSAFLKQFPQA